MMRSKPIFRLALTLMLALVSAASVAADTVRPRPLVDVVKTKAKPVSRSGATQVPVITWGGDVATVHAEQGGYFGREGLDVELFLENNFPKQVEAVLSGRTPYLRGTMGMINSAAEVFEREGVDLVVVYQLTWSTGGDAMVVRPGVRRPSDLKGKTVALQLYGPHMDYLANILNSGRVPLGSIDYRWYPELTLPTFDTKGKTLDPVTAFTADSGIDAVMSIIPDALALTSGGEEGTGAAGSVKGAKVLLSTKTASRVIADVYAVRGDYLRSNRSQVQNFVAALLKAQEGLDQVVASKASQRSTYQQLLSRSADLLLGSPQATPDIEALLGDCSFVGHAGNVAFFTGQGTTRNLKNLTREGQTSFRQLGLMKGTAAVADAGWDYAKLASGLKNTGSVRSASRQQFDSKRVAAKVEKKIAVEPSSWAEEGTLFQIEINFQPNQSEFSARTYADDFSEALKIAQTYGGSLIIIEGHSDPLGILKAQQNRESTVVINQMQQQAKNLSLQRARAVRESFLDYCKRNELVVDESQFLAVGFGVGNPKFNPPRTKAEWDANRRVVFRIKQVEAELTEFTPLN